MVKTVYSVGYGNRKIDQFIDLLKTNRIKALIDIRTNPSSRFQPVYNRKALTEAMQIIGIDYVFLGLELGGKPKDKSLYTNDIVDYSKIKESKEYQNGISELIKYIESGIETCIMCAELDPNDCHRKNLVAETLHDHGIDTIHILKSGDLFWHSAYKNSQLF